MIFTNKELKILTSWGLERALGGSSKKEDRILHNKIRDLEYSTQRDREKKPEVFLTTVDCSYGEKASFEEVKYSNTHTGSSLVMCITCKECGDIGRLELVFNTKKRMFRYECSHCDRVVTTKEMQKILDEYEE